MTQTIQVFDPDRIKDLLRKYNVSQNKLSIYSGYARTYIQRCLSGEQKPSEQAAENINRAVNQLTGSRTFDYREMEVIQELMGYSRLNSYPKPTSMTEREWQQFLEKLK